jgi:hypothetical protein
MVGYTTTHFNFPRPNFTPYFVPQIFWYNVLANASNPSEQYFPPMGVHTGHPIEFIDSNGGKGRGLDTMDREYWIKSHTVLVDYSAPTPHNNDYSQSFANGTYKTSANPGYDAGYDPYHGE